MDLFYLFNFICSLILIRPLNSIESKIKINLIEGNIKINSIEGNIKINLIEGNIKINLIEGNIKINFNSIYPLVLFFLSILFIP